MENSLLYQELEIVFFFGGGGQILNSRLDLLYFKERGEDEEKVRFE